MIVFPTQVVINVNFGGFSFDTEMALWLSENRGWTIISEKEYDYKKNDYPINVLVDCGNNRFYSPHNDKNDKIKLRTNLDLIDCVKALKEKHKDDKFPRQEHIHNLAIKTVEVDVDVFDHHDGKERVECWMHHPY